MSKNIKEIGKELLGRSLNSFHRKTGLPQLEKNNEMQDGILDGILSQVDDAYIEKTEQSNVIHLEGSGDGVVVLDSIEGNTKVNLIQKMNSVFSRTDSVNKGNSYLKMNHCLKPNTKYTRFVKVEKMTLNNNKVLLMCDSINDSDGTYKQYSYNITKPGWYIDEITTPSIGTTDTYVINPALSHFYEGSGTYIEISNVMIVEGGKEDNATITEFFEGLQSSFEEQVEDNKYEIEILSNNKNLFDGKLSSKPQHGGATVKHIDKNNFRVKATNAQYASVCYELKVKPNETYTLKVKGTKIKAQGGVYVRIYDKDDSYKSEEVTNVSLIENSFEKELKFTTKELSSNKFYGVQFYCVGQTTNTDGEWLYENVQLEKGTNSTNYVPHKQNKIKLLLNSPLLKGDKLVVKDGKLCHYHKMKKIILNGSDNESWIFAPSQNTDNTTLFYIRMLDAKSRREVLCDKFGQRRKDHDLWASSTETNYEAMFINHNRDILTRINTSKLSSVSISGFKQWLKTNNVTVVYELEEPYYEEVLNEYGEPILLKGYENGTLYIDSTVIPTTTVRYTPKMESFKTLKEVNKNNNLTTLDINENIIPYMMDVDYMIMEKELCLLNTKNIRKMEVLDMTSMQKRTQDMLERLIKGKTLTEQECKTRITTYVHAGKITDEQAEELMLLIDEVYA